VTVTIFLTDILIRVLIVFGFVAYIVLTVVLFQDEFRKEPYDLFGITDTARVH
jgi:hypothetical protein